MSDVVIRCEGLTRRFGDFVAVDHVTFEVAAGEIIGYLGPNGSGKTTTMRMLLGLLQPSEGRAIVLGHDAFRESEYVRARTGYMSQKFALYDDLTVLENMRFYAGVYGIADSARVARTLDMVGLQSHHAATTRSLSAGWRQRLALGIALVHKPRILFLDEPTSGVDPTARRAFWDLIYALAEDGVTVLVSTHYMDEAEYCGRVALMRAGQLLALDTPARLKRERIEGAVWELAGEPLTAIIGALDQVTGVLKVALAGDHVRVTASHDVASEVLLGALDRAGVTGAAVTAGEPSLEDAFLSLAL